MRQWIELAENAFPAVSAPVITLPKGTVLYHGTDRPPESWDPETQPILLPAWFSTEIDVARQYSEWKRSGQNGEAAVYRYVLKHDANLADISSLGEEMDALYGNYTSDEIADWAIEAGFDGWFVKDEEVMLGYDMVEFEGRVLKHAPVD